MFVSETEEGVGDALRAPVRRAAAGSGRGGPAGPRPASFARELKIITRHLDS